MTFIKQNFILFVFILFISFIVSSFSLSLSLSIYIYIYIVNYLLLGYIKILLIYMQFCHIYHKNLCVTRGFHMNAKHLLLVSFFNGCCIMVSLWSALKSIRGNL